MSTDSFFKGSICKMLSIKRLSVLLIGTTIIAAFFLSAESNHDIKNLTSIVLDGEKASAQYPTWSKTFSSCEINSSILTPADGGAILVGDPCVIKIDASGNVTWSKGYYGSQNNMLRSIAPINDGIDGYVLAGFSNSYSFGVNNYDAWVIRIDRLGNMIWQKTYGGNDFDEAFSIATTDDGFIVGGYSGSYSQSQYLYAQGWVFKLDTLGNILWQKNLDGGEFVASIIPINGGVDGFTGVGRAVFGSGGNDAWVFHLHNNGSLAWQYAYGGVYDDETDTILQTKDGGYVMAGYTMSYGYNSDGWILKLDDQGSLIWQKTYGNAFADYVNAVAPIYGGDDGYVVAGYTTSIPSSQGFDDGWLFKIDSTGNILWSRTYGGGSQDLFRSLSFSNDSGYLVTGYSGSFGGGWALQTDLDGNLHESCIQGIPFQTTIAVTPVSPANYISVPPDTKATPTNSNATPQTIQMHVEVQCLEPTIPNPTHSPTLPQEFEQTATPQPITKIFLPILVHN